MRNVVLTLMVLVAGMALGCDTTDRAVGAACGDDFDCQDRCLRDWPGGFCTLSCRDNRDCPRDAVCVESRGDVCMLLCGNSGECKDWLGDNDYACHGRRDVHDERWDVCVPD